MKELLQKHFDTSRVRSDRPLTLPSPHPMGRGKDANTPGYFVGDGCRPWIRTMTNRSRVCCATVTPVGSLIRGKVAVDGAVRNPEMVIAAQTTPDVSADNGLQIARLQVVLGACGLEIRDTAGWKPALRAETKSRNARLQQGGANAL